MSNTSPPPQGPTPSSPVSTSRLRHRKISVKQQLCIYRSTDIDHLAPQQFDDELLPQGRTAPVTPTSTGTSTTGNAHVALTVDTNRTDELQTDDAETNPNAKSSSSFISQDIETGVEKNEEQEVHLRRILLSSLHTPIAATSQHSIPVPEVIKLDDSKARLEYSKNYHRVWHQELYENSYIKFSATVEDCCGGSFAYFMDEIDEKFLQALNKSHLKMAEAKTSELSEDEFELMCTAFGAAVRERQPFLTMDPESIIAFDEVKLCLERLDFGNRALREELARELGLYNGKQQQQQQQQQRQQQQQPDEQIFETKFDYYQYYDNNNNNNNDTAGKHLKCRPLKLLLELYGLQVYEHWKQRKIKVGGGEIFPQLKFERPGECEEVNPYVCFRRRELRQPRRTRKIDIATCQKLRLLRNELQHAREMALLVAKREQTGLRSFENDKTIFEARCRMRELRRTFNIGSGDDKLLVASRAELRSRRRPVLTLEKKMGLCGKQEAQKAGTTTVVIADRENLKLKLKVKLKSDSGQDRKAQHALTSNDETESTNAAASTDSSMMMTPSKKQVVKDSEDVNKNQKMKQLQQTLEGHTVPIKKQGEHSQAVSDVDGVQNEDKQSQLDGSGRLQEQEQQQQKQKPKQKQKQKQKQKIHRSQQSQKNEFSQVYVGLPSCKIPELVQQSLDDLTRKKREAAMEYVREKFAKRKREDESKGFVNMSFDAHNPVFDLCPPNENEVPYPENVPFVSIPSSRFKIQRLYNFPDVDRYLSLGVTHEGEKDIGNTEATGNRDTNGTSSGHTVDKPVDVNVYDREGNRITERLAFQPTQFYSPFSSDKQVHSREYPFVFRRRRGRCGLEYLDYRPNPASPSLQHLPTITTSSDDNPIKNESLLVNHPNASRLTDFVDLDAIESEEADPNRVIDVYSSRADELSRLYYTRKYESSSPFSGPSNSTPFSSEPAKLSNVSDSTHAIRFGAIISGKSYEQLKKVTLNYRWDYIKMVKLQKYNMQRQAQMQLPQQQQRRQQQQQQQQQQQLLREPQQVQQHIPPGEPLRRRQQKHHEEFQFQLQLKTEQQTPKQKQDQKQHKEQPGVNVLHLSNEPVVREGETNGNNADWRYRRVMSNASSPDNRIKRVKTSSTPPVTPTPINFNSVPSALHEKRTPPINFQSSGADSKL